MKVWRLSALGFCPTLTGLNAVVDWLLERIEKEEISVLTWIVIVCWTICSFRNELLFNGKRRERDEHWRPPQADSIKINTDAAKIS